MTLRWRQGPSYWSCHLLFLRVHSSRKLGREYGRATWTALGVTFLLCHRQPQPCSSRSHTASSGLPEAVH